SIVNPFPYPEDSTDSIPSQFCLSKPYSPDLSCHGPTKNQRTGDEPAHNHQDYTGSHSSSRRARRTPTSSSLSYMTGAATLLRRLFNNPLYSDTVLIVDESTFHVHRGALAKQCRYFCDLFKAAWTHDPTSELERLDCPFERVEYKWVHRLSTSWVEIDDAGIDVSQNKDICHSKVRNYTKGASRRNPVVGKDDEEEGCDGSFDTLRKGSSQEPSQDAFKICIDSASTLHRLASLT
ncbi:hypothetical protein BG011_002217, partial [Mortierella polycephala]